MAEPPNEPHCVHLFERIKYSYVDENNSTHTGNGLVVRFVENGIILESGKFAPAFQSCLIIFQYNDRTTSNIVPLKNCYKDGYLHKEVTKLIQQMDEDDETLVWLENHLDEIQYDSSVVRNGWPPHPFDPSASEWTVPVRIFPQPLPPPTLPHVTDSNAMGSSDNLPTAPIVNDSDATGEHLVCCCCCCFVRLTILIFHIFLLTHHQICLD